MEQRVDVARRPAFAASDWVNAAAWCCRPLPGSRFIFSSSRGKAQSGLVHGEWHGQRTAGGDRDPGGDFDRYTVEPGYWLCGPA
jgi:hypothetical protein